ncbi:replicative DNA helicase [Sphingobacteriales bacterium UPWRP_1]|nr:replicative DNA helicase [Sphingobacteriales bacterium TSM_CSS]PSJ79001.1 replicative DNA helicase [Sphingobacteriales bacterium UPWRP_1]
MPEQDENLKSPRNKTNTGRNQTDLSSFVFDKVPPQALDLEEVVLGGMMLDRDAVAEIIDILKPDSFYLEAHRHIYQAIYDLFGKAQPIDIITVCEQLRKNGKLEAAGGPYYVSKLTNRVATAANIEHHARIISEKFILRELIKSSTQVVQNAYEETTDVFDLLNTAEQSLFSITEQNLRRSYDKMNTLIAQAIKNLETLKEHNTEGLTGVPTGFPALDRLTSGWQKSDLIIIAARPAMGKCLGKGTKVLMYDGTLKNVEDIIAGDLLMGDDSTPRTVLGINTGRENMYWIHQNHGISYRVNESHILSLKRSRSGANHKHGDVLNIAVREYLQQSEKFKTNYKGYKVSVEFDEKPLPVNPYFLGLWLGDGHSYSSRITNTDNEIIDFLGVYAEELELELVEDNQKNKTPNYAITKNMRGKQKFFSIQGQLRGLNLLENKHIPHIYLANTSENRLQLLAGLIDSDGHYNKEFNVYEITQKNGRLARDVKFLCDSLGFKTSLVKEIAQITERNFESDAFRVRISGDIEKIPTRIERKKARTRKSIVDWRHTGITVEFDKVDDYYGFEIDGNRLFLLEDMTVTHNTAFVLSVARNAAVDFKRPVAVFSLEMSKLQLVNRLISAETGLASEKLRRGDLQPYEWVQLTSRVDRLSEAPLIIDDTPAINLFELRAKCRRFKMQHDIQLIIIDYLQLMSGTSADKKNFNREQEISNISRTLKTIAKELDVPVIALSQLSRAVETRGGDKRPQLADLRESGAIEQDADLVLFLYRPEYYGLEYDADQQPTRGIAEVIIAKHRNGPLDTVKLKFIGQHVKFENLEIDPVKGNEVEPIGDIIIRGSRTGYNNGGSIDDEEVPF